MPEGQTGKAPVTHPEILFHFSEDPTIARFEPRLALPPLQQEVVWAVDPGHEHLYFFPRDCPRVTFYATPESSAEDIERFFGHSAASIVAAIESGWLQRLRSTALYRYQLPAAGFDCTDAGAGYWVCEGTVEPLHFEPVGDLLQALASAGVELRITPSLWPLREAVIASTMQFSIIRWRNAAPRFAAAPPVETGGMGG